MLWHFLQKLSIFAGIQIQIIKKTWHDNFLSNFVHESIIFGHKPIWFKFVKTDHQSLYCVFKNKIKLYVRVRAHRPIHIFLHTGCV